MWLIGILKNKVQGCNLFKFHALCKELKITHLSFADNLLILIAVNLLSIHMVKEGLEEFIATVCLAVNPARVRFSALLYLRI